MPKGDNRKDATYSPDRKMKLCKGALHRQGVYLPVSRFHVLKSGRRAGKHMSECADCWRARQGSDYSVPVEHVLPLIDRLVAHVGSNEALCARIGVYKNQISVVRKQKRVRGKFVEKLKALDNEIARENQRRWQNQMEPEVVESEPLGQVLRDWCRDWLRERPVGPEDYMGPIDHLHQMLKRPAISHEMSMKLISQICNSKKQFVGLSQADALLTAIGRTEMLTNGEIKVMANPSWSLEAYMGYMRDRACV